MKNEQSNKKIGKKDDNVQTVNGEVINEQKRDENININEELKELEEKLCDESQIVKDAITLFIGGSNNDGIDLQMLNEDASKKTWLKLIKHQVFAEDNEENDKKFFDLIIKYRKAENVNFAQQTKELKHFLREHLTPIQFKFINKPSINKKENLEILDVKNQNYKDKDIKLSSQSSYSYSNAKEGKTFNFLITKVLLTFFIYYIFVRLFICILNDQTNFERKYIEASTPEFLKLKELQFITEDLSKNTKRYYLDILPPKMPKVKLSFKDRELFYFFIIFISSILHTILKKAIHYFMIGIQLNSERKTIKID